MAQKKLENMSMTELKALQSDVAKAIADFEKRKRSEALKEMEAVAKKHGFSMKDMLGGSGSKASKSKAPAKYANPDDSSQTWSGRGRQPAWFKDAMAAGKSVEELTL